MADSTKNFSQFPLLWLAVCFAGGVFVAQFVKPPLHFWMLISIVSVILVCWRFYTRNFKQATIFLLISFIFIGTAFYEVEKRSVAPDRISRIYDGGQINFKTPVELTGVLQTEPEQTPDGYFLTLKTEKIAFNQTEQTASGAVRLFLPVNNSYLKQDYENLNLHYGARIRVAVRLTREDRYRNPGGANYKEILTQRDLDASGTIKDILNIQRLDDATVFPPLAWLYSWRANLIKQFNEHFSTSTTGVLAASLLNNRYFLDKPTSERFREGGTFHILVISGVHITFIGFLMAWLVQRITQNFLVQFVAANTLLWIYAVAVGAEISVTRAALMFTILHTSALFYRESTPLNSLGAAVLLLLVWRPSDLFDQSFQLTILSVTAIIAVALPVLEKMRQIGAWQPAEKTPAPPVCPHWLKSFCEALFWSESGWQRTQKRSVWKANLFKSAFPQKIEKWNLQSVLQIIFSTIFVSIVVTAWLLPLMAVYFHRLSFAGLFLNIFVGFLIALESFVGVFALLVANISPTLAQPFIAWTELFNFLLVYSAEPFVQTDSASIRLPVYTGVASAVYWLYYLPLIGLAVAVHRWNPFYQSAVSSQQLSKNKLGFFALITVYCSLLTVIVFHPFSAASTNGRLRVDFLDVGQGDAALITTPNGTKILVDGGGRPNFSPMKKLENGETEVFVPDSRSVGESVVCEFLWEKGYGQVDFLTPSHADFDHIDGLNDVAQNFRVQTAFAGRTPPNDAEFSYFARILEKRGVNVVKISRGEVLEIDGVKIEVLYPAFDTNADAPSDNNHSVVFRLVYGSRSFLFTGDIEAQTEQILAQQPELLVSDVVKVAHHGSKTSSTESFVATTKAKFAVIPVGRESPYGHPHPQTLERWHNTNAQILTTGESGTISFTTDGTDLQLETFVK